MQMLMKGAAHVRQTSSKQASIHPAKKRGKISQIYISINILFINTRAFAVSKQRHKRCQAVRMDAPPCGVLPMAGDCLGGDREVAHMDVDAEVEMLVGGAQAAEAPQVKCNIGAGK